MAATLITAVRERLREEESTSAAARWQASQRWIQFRARLRWALGQMTISAMSGATLAGLLNSTAFCPAVR